MLSRSVHNREESNSDLEANEVLSNTLHNVLYGCNKDKATKIERRHFNQDDNVQLLTQFFIDKKSFKKLGRSDCVSFSGNIMKENI
jgi:hypothetical protein